MIKRPHITCVKKLVAFLGACVLLAGLIACQGPVGNNLVISEKALNNTKPVVSPPMRLRILQAPFKYILADKNKDAKLHSAVALAPVLPLPENWQEQEQDGSDNIPVGTTANEAPVAHWYAKVFNTGFALEGKQMRLDITGLKKPARFWLNGQLLGEFQPVMNTQTVDISRLFIPGGENALVMRQSIDTSQAYDLVREALAGKLEVPLAPNAHLELRTSGDISIEKAQASAPLLAGTQIPDITAHLSVFNAATKPQYIIVKAQVLPANFSEKPAITRFGRLHKPGLFKVLVKPGMNDITVKPETRPMRLWWPGSFGSKYEYGAHLYKLELGLYSDTNQLDATSVPIGLRTIGTIRTKEKSGTDTKAVSFNKKPVFFKGVTYRSNPAKHPRTRTAYLKDLTLAIKANANAVLIDADAESPLFYDLCDELGIAVFQQLPENYVFDTDKAPLPQWLVAHPSLTGWFISKPPRQQMDIDTQAANMEPDIQSSGEESEIPETYAGLPVFAHNESFAAKGVDKGNWFEYALPETREFVESFGAPSLPSLPVMQDMFGPSVGLPSTKQGWRMFETFGFDKLTFFSIAKIESGRSLPTFIRNTQLYQARLTQLAAESMRIQRFAPVQAAFANTLIDTTPKIGWGLVDSAMTPKPAYEALQKAYQPILPSMMRNKADYWQGDTVTIGLFAVNDTFRPVKEATYNFELFRDGVLLYLGQYPIELKASERKAVARWSKEELPIGKYTVRTSITDANKVIYGKNYYEFFIKGR